MKIDFPLKQVKKGMVQMIELTQLFAQNPSEEASLQLKFSPGPVA